MRSSKGYEMIINDEYCWKHESPDGGWTCALCRKGNTMKTYLMPISEDMLKTIQDRSSKLKDAQNDLKSSSQINNADAVHEAIDEAYNVLDLISWTIENEHCETIEVSESAQPANLT